MQQEFLEAVYHQHALVGKQRLNILHNCTKNLKYFKQVNGKRTEQHESEVFHNKNWENIWTGQKDTYHIC